MAQTVTWQIRNKSVEEGQSAELIAEGFAAFEEAIVYIKRPNGSIFKWGIRADGNGRVFESIKLDSGLGQYVFQLDPSCGYHHPEFEVVNLCPCSVSDQRCNIKIEGPSVIIPGQKNTFIASGLTPGKKVAIRLANNESVTNFRDGIADADGICRFELEWNAYGRYALTFADQSCVSAPHIIDAVSALNEIPGISLIHTEDCSLPISIHSVTDRAQYGFNQIGTVKVSVQNTSPVARNVSFVIDLQFGDTTIESQSVPYAAEILGNSVKEHLIIFRTGNRNEIISGQIRGSYVCNNKVYTANGTAFTASVGKGTGVCSAILQFFGSESGGESYLPNENIPIEVTVRNTGNVPIEKLNISEFPLPQNCNLISGLPGEMTNILPGQTGTHIITVSFSNEGYYTVALNPGAIKFSCNGSDFSVLNQPGFVSFDISNV